MSSQKAVPATSQVIKYPNMMTSQVIDWQIK